MAALAVFAALAVATRVDAVLMTVPGLFNTGVDASGNPLPAGTIDPHYTLIASDDPLFPGPSAFVTLPVLPATWTSDTSTGKWISPNPVQSPQDVSGPPPTVGNAAGTYIYQLSFDLTGLDPKTVAISGAWATSTIGLIELNVGSPGGGYVAGTTNLNGPGAYTGFTIPVGSAFHAGINTLDFVVVNAATGATGLHVERLSGNGIPEPSTIVLATIGFVGLVALRRRRGRKA
jgi:hypothetical protein